MLNIAFHQSLTIDSKLTEFEALETQTYDYRPERCLDTSGVDGGEGRPGLSRPLKVDDNADTPRQNSKIVARRYPLAEFRSPYIPDQDREELPNSRVLHLSILISRGIVKTDTHQASFSTLMTVALYNAHAALPASKCSFSKVRLFNAN